MDADDSSDDSDGYYEPEVEPENIGRNGWEVKVEKDKKSNLYELHAQQWEEGRMRRGILSNFILPDGANIYVPKCLQCDIPFQSWTAAVKHSREISYIVNEYE